MMQDYKFQLLAAVLMLAAMLGTALAYPLPAALAAPIAMWLALRWGIKADEVGKRFRSDVERILANTPAEEAMKRFGIHGSFFGMIVASATAQAVGAALGAAAGIVALLIAMIRMTR